VVAAQRAVATAQRAVGIVQRQYSVAAVATGHRAVAVATAQRAVATVQRAVATAQRAVATGKRATAAVQHAVATGAQRQTRPGHASQSAAPARALVMPGAGAKARPKTKRAAVVMAPACLWDGGHVRPIWRARHPLSVSVRRCGESASPGGSSMIWK
jgi:hypothetical protein